MPTNELEQRLYSLYAMRVQRGVGDDPIALLHAAARIGAKLEEIAARCDAAAARGGKESASYANFAAFIRARAEKP